jgi:hypothetical protein
MTELNLIDRFYGEGDRKKFAIDLLAIVNTDYDEAKVASDHIPHIAMNSCNHSISSATYNTLSLLSHNSTILNRIGENGFPCGVINGAPEQHEHSARYDMVATIISRILDKNRGGLALQEFMPFILTRLFPEITGNLFEIRTFTHDDNNTKVVITPLHNGTSFNNGVFAYATKNSNVKTLSASAIIDEWVHNGKNCSKTIGQLVTVVLNGQKRYKVINLHLDRDRISALGTIPRIAKLIKDDSQILEIVGDFNLPSNIFLKEMKKYTNISLESNYDIPPEYQGVDHSFRIIR